MSKIFSKAFWADAGIRALKTIVQTAVGMLTADQAGVNIDWKAIALASIVAGAMSLYQSFVAADTQAEPKVETQ